MAFSPTGGMIGVIGSGAAIIGYGAYYNKTDTNLGSPIKLALNSFK